MRHQHCVQLIHKVDVPSADVAIPDPVDLKGVQYLPILYSAHSETVRRPSATHPTEESPDLLKMGLEHREVLKGMDPDPLLLDLLQLFQPVAMLKTPLKEVC